MKTILIIDDDDSVRDVINIRFHRDFTILEAENGTVGQEKFKQFEPDLVIVDLIMPEKEGFETILSIRKENDTVPIIVITGLERIGGVSSLEIAQQFGASAGFLKPLDLKALSATVYELLSQ